MRKLYFQHARLMPLIAMTFAIHIFSKKFLEQTVAFQGKMFGSDDKALLASEGLEIHALSCATKPLCSWLVQDAIQVCREACGGHGYLKGYCYSYCLFFMFIVYYCYRAFYAKSTGSLPSYFLLLSKLFSSRN